MSALSPDQPWLYLVIYGSFMVFLITVGLILTLTQRKKNKQGIEEETTK